MILTENSLKVLRARYLLKDEAGRVRESPEELFRRVASAVASAETQYGEDAPSWQEKFYELLRSKF